MIVNDSIYAIAAHKDGGKSQSQRNESINMIGAESASKFLLQRKELTSAVHSLIVKPHFIKNFR